jgi:ubiquinone biosynthesis protein UbiJ
VRVFYTMNPNFDLPKALLVRGINHVLQREEWALRDLKKHDGKIIRLVLPVSETWIQINASGHIDLLGTEVESAHLTLEVSNESLTRISEASGSFQERVVKAVKIAGDAELAQLIAKLAGQLRWEYEEDLAQVIGDAPAHFIVSQAKRFHELTQKAILDLQQNVIEYLSEEKKVLVHQREFLSHKIALQDLRDAVERLEKRIGHLQKIQDSL